MSDVENERIGELTLGYFGLSWGKFWRWADKGQVLEWIQLPEAGTTICYRADLAGILRGLQEQGLPPFPAVLLLLAACADRLPGGDGHAAYLREQTTRFFASDGDPELAQITQQLQQVNGFLDVVRALPPALRSGAPKLHLFREVVSNQAPQVAAELAPAVLDEWESGRQDEWLSRRMGRYTRRALLQELDCLAQAFHRFPTTEQLALLLRTGLDQLPTPLPTPEPLPAAPEEPLSLLDQLAQDQRTAGLANLTQHLIAGLHIPMHTHGASDQPLGGIADVTNRGNFDCLLLSELAHDDLSLMARLVNNEALYLRREEPPRPQARPRVILLDTTLRLWGTPRVFGLAAALAWAYYAHLPRTRAALTAYALGGQASTPLDLDSFDGIVEALSALDPALHCGPALQAFGLDRPTAAGTDYLLITEAQAAQQPEFSQLLAAAQPGLRYLLTVDRTGELALFEYLNGHRTLVSASRYDLDELLIAPRARRSVRPALPLAGPAFLQCVPAPLYFPTTSMRLSSRNAVYSSRLGALAVTDTRRVLYWPDRLTGARELLPAIEAGTYYFGTDGDAEFYILVSGPGLLRVYLFGLQENDAEAIDLIEELDKPEQTVNVVFNDNCYFVRRSGSTLVFDCLQRVVLDRRSSFFPATTPSGFRPDFGTFKRHINNGYSIFHRISRISVGSDGALLVDGYELDLLSHASTLTHHLQFLVRTPSSVVIPDRAKATATDLTPATTGNPALTRRFIWPDGSEALVDTRGLLHLRSADAGVPEMTVLLIIGQPTAGWAADGTVSGSPYFTGPKPAQRVSAVDFYRQYLKRFTAPLA